LYNVEFILTALIITIFINMTSSVIYNFIFNRDNIFISGIVLFISTVLIVFILAILKDQRDLYAPIPIAFALVFQDHDIKDFLDKNRSDIILNYMSEKKFKDFNSFGEDILKNITHMFPFIFYYKGSYDCISYKKEFTDNFYEPHYPTHKALYDLSSLATTGVKIQLEIIIEPHIVFEISNELGDLTSVRSFKVIFRFIILNPTHHHSDDVINGIYHYDIFKLPEQIAISIEKAFIKNINKK